MQKKSFPLKKIFLIISLSALVFASLNLILIKYVNYSGGEEINQVGSEIFAENSRPLSIINNVIDWEENKIRGRDVTYQKLHFLNFYVLSKRPFIYLRNSDPQWIMFFKRGACYEFSNLFAEIGESADLENVRMVRGLGKDHIWNEVKVENAWVHVDPSKPDPVTGEIGIIDNPYFYERNRSENGEGEDLLFVYALDGRKNHGVERTKKYIKKSKLSKLKISVEKGGEPVGGARVTITKGNTDSAPFFTNENGVCSFNLTENRTYKVSAESGWVIGHKRTREVYISENIAVSINLSTLSLQPPFQKISAYFVLAFLIAFPVLIIFFIANTIGEGIITEVFREYEFSRDYISIAGFLSITIGLFYAVVLGIGLLEVLTLTNRIISGNLGQIIPEEIGIVLAGWMFLSSAGMIWSFKGTRKIKEIESISFKEASKILVIGVIFWLLYGGAILGNQILLLSMAFFIFSLIPRITNRCRS